jgi:hypothetical protein
MQKWQPIGCLTAKKREVQIMQYLRFFDGYGHQTDIGFKNELTKKDREQYMHIGKYKSFCYLDEEDFDEEQDYYVNNEVGFLETVESSFEGEPDYYSIQYYDTTFDCVETYTTFKDLLQVKAFYEQKILNGNEKFFLNNRFYVAPQKFGERYDTMEC